VNFDRWPWKIEEIDFLVFHPPSHLLEEEGLDLISYGLQIDEIGQEKHESHEENGNQSNTSSRKEK